ncbi:MAG: 50S ribosomal protein L11 methyltransferase [Dehalococcoidia bacterium]
MKWLEITVAAAGSDVEAVADLLRAHSPGGVSIEEPLDLSRDDGLLSVDPNSLALVKAYLLCDDRLADRERALRRELSELRLSRPLAPCVTRQVQEEDWAASWKEHFQVERIGRRLVVRPRWRQYEAQPSDIVIDLDPGMAFGTGQHATTRMCLVALEERLRPGCRLLDLGTGSGILAIAGPALGASEVVALDNDPLAVTVAAANVAANGVSDRVTVREGSLGDVWPLGAPWRGAFDCLVANISSTTIIALAESLVQALASGGLGIGGGIGGERCDECRLALEAADGRVVEVMAEGDWRTLVFEAR